MIGGKYISGSHIGISLSHDQARQENEILQCSNTNEKLISSMYINLYIVRQKYFHMGYLTIERYSPDNETMKSYYKITTNVQILFVKHTNT